MKIRAIALHQPWASLIFSGDKHHETRAWPCPAHVVGTRIAICAAKKLTLRGLPAVLMSRLLELFGNDRPPAGVILGTALVQSCKLAQDAVPVSRFDFLSGDWTRDRYVWRLTDVRPLATPIPVTCRQSWFTVEIPEGQA